MSISHKSLSFKIVYRRGENTWEFPCVAHSEPSPMGGHDIEVGTTTLARSGSFMRIGLSGKVKRILGKLPYMDYDDIVACVKWISGDMLTHQFPELIRGRLDFLVPLGVLLCKHFYPDRQIVLEDCCVIKTTQGLDMLLTLFNHMTGKEHSYSKYGFSTERDCGKISDLFTGMTLTDLPEHLRAPFELNVLPATAPTRLSDVVKHHFLVCRDQAVINSFDDIYTYVRPECDIEYAWDPSTEFPYTSITVNSLDEIIDESM